MAKKDYIAGLDVGSSKVCVTVGSVNTEGKVEIAGIGVSPASGIKQGNVTDLTLASECIDEAVSIAEEKSGVSIHRVFVGVVGCDLNTFHSKGTVAIADRESEITHRDAERAVTIAKDIALPLERQIIHTVNLGYSIDGYAGVKDPVGLYGAKLSVDLNLITAPYGQIQNLIKSVNGAGLELEGIFPSGTASALAILTEEEKQDGVILLDIGESLSDILVFAHGVSKEFHVLAVGTKDMGEAIASYLKIPYRDAQKIMKNFITFPGDSLSTDEKIQIRTNWGDKSVPRKELCVLAQEKVKEIFRQIKEKLSFIGFPESPHGIVLTGGLSLFDGAVELCGEYFEVPTRLGYSRNVFGSLVNITNSTYAASVGLLLYGAQRRKHAPYRNGKPNLSLISRAFLRAKELYSEYF